MITPQQQLLVETVNHHLMIHLERLRKKKDLRSCRDTLFKLFSDSYWGGYYVSSDVIELYFLERVPSHLKDNPLSFRLSAENQRIVEIYFTLWNEWRYAWDMAVIEGWLKL